MNEGRCSITVSSAPPAEPVTRAQAKFHLHINDTDTDHDTYIDALITAVREKTEAYLGRALVRQTQILTLDCFPCGDGIIHVPNPPLAAVSAVQYVDANGATQTVSSANYTVDASSAPGRIEPAYGFAWPVTRNQIAAVSVTYTCGYTPSNDSPTDYAVNVPKSIRQAMLLSIGTLFENRESVLIGNMQAIQIPDSAAALLWSQRVMSV